MQHVDILIVGAGPTGLTAATLLARYGIPFRIIEKKAGPTDQSKALGVQARTLELWHKLGLAEEAIKAGQQAHSFQLLTEDAATRGYGKPLLTLDRDGLSTTPYPFLLIFEQYKTEQLLLDDLVSQGGQVNWESEITNLEQDSTGVTVTVRAADGTEEQLRAKWLVAADGAHSFVRRALNLSFEGSTYNETLFLADVLLDWSLPRDVFFVELMSYGMLVFFPMRGSGYSENQYRLVGSLPPELRESHEITQAAIQNLLDTYSNSKAHVSNVLWSSVYRIHRRMTEQFQIGRIFLAGDAAHIHSPAGGQGMNTGIQDAWNLSWKLALVARGEAHETLLASYAPERMPVARTVLNGSDRGFSFVASNKPWVRLLRNTVVPLIAKLTGHTFLGKQLFRFVSQTWINYGGSPVVAGEATSEAYPGARAPHAEFDYGLQAGQSVLELLRGVDHHLLLFPGKTEPRFQQHYAELLTNYATPIHLHTIDMVQHSVYAAYAVEQPSAFLIRPDGHIAWRGKLEHASELQAYLDQWYPPKTTLSEAIASKHIKSVAEALMR